MHADEGADGFEKGLPMTEGAKTVLFGRFQDKPIRWRILDRVEGKALLLSSRVLDNRSFHNRKEPATWATCDLRQWLNGEFLELAFDPDQRERIVESEIADAGNSEYGTSGPAPTSDRIFCLSEAEVLRYCPTAAKRRAKATDYACSQGAWQDNRGESDWWLRTPGSNHRSAIDVMEGCCFTAGWDIDTNRCGVRPALWLSIEDEKGNDCNDEEGDERVAEDRAHPGSDLL